MHAHFRDDLERGSASLGALLVVTRCDMVTPAGSFACSRKKRTKNRKTCCLALVGCVEYAAPVSLTPTLLSVLCQAVLCQK